MTVLGFLATFSLGAEAVPVAVSAALPSPAPSLPAFPFSAPEVFCTSELSVSSPENPETSESLAAKSENALSSLYCSASVHTILPAENRKTAAQTIMAMCIPIFFFIPVPSLLMLNFKGFPVICQRNLQAIFCNKILLPYIACNLLHFGASRVMLILL